MSSHTLEQVAQNWQGISGFGDTQNSIEQNSDAHPLTSKSNFVKKFKLDYL